MKSLDEFAAGKIRSLAARSLLRTLQPTERLDGLWILRGGRRLLSFCCNDYLNLSQHPAVKAAAQAAVERYGAGAGASRLVTGNTPLLDELERRLAVLKGAEAACVFGSGYLANAGIIPTLVGENDLILVDELVHSCIWTGAKLAGAPVAVFRHNDLGHLAELLQARRRKHERCLIATDGVFSMDGDLAPVHDLAALAADHDAWLLTDDAHGIGVVGGGRGSSFIGGRKADVPLQMGTLSKAVGSYGGYLCAAAPVIDLIKSRSRTLVYSTGLPPASAGAALAALDLIEGDAALVARPVLKARLFTGLMGLPPAESPIVPVIIGDAAAALDAAKRLEADGFLVTAIRPPTVAPGTSRLRITFTANHPEAEIERLAKALRAQGLGR
ncbi:MULTISPECIES: aminotransferase class I/II-fold pyridoxal phosphate-dependent enzyme [unclassified Inquilinus]|uniref:aminotransferase class I/II-fold pyridoxal phosphate-dependent enzyme n=1 Tax=unclassified Inquilinus TaxID=2645927 RepID=UPI003F8EBF42